MAIRTQRRAPGAPIAGLVLAGLCLIQSWAALSAAPIQHPRIDQISVDDGLPHGTVYSITQDPTGFLWFGTEDGLARFDGYRFTVFSHEPTHADSLTTNQASHVFADSKGRLWVGTWGGGLERFDSVTGVFEHHLPDPNDDTALRDSRIQCLLEDRSGDIWLGTLMGGLARFDPEKGTFEHYRHDPDNPETLSHDRVWSVAEDLDGGLWVGTSNGLNYFDPATGRVERFPFREGRTDGPLHPEVRAVHVDNLGAVWIGTRSGLSRLEPSTRAFRHFLPDDDDPHSLSNDVINTIFEDRRQRLWIGTMYGGVNLWNADHEHFTVFRHELGAPHSLAYNDVRAIFEDRSGLIWIGTRGEGVNKLDPGTPFGGLHQETDTRPGLSHDRVWSILENEDRSLLVGTQSGLDWVDRDNETVVHYRHDPRRGQGLGPGDVRALHRDQRGRLWVATQVGGLQWLAASEKMGPISSNPRFRSVAIESLGDGVILDLVEAPSGDIFVASTAGVYGIDPENLEVTVELRDDSALHDKLSENRVNTLLFDNSGMLWLATEHRGLDRYDPTTGAIRRYRNDPIDQSTLSRNDVLSVFQDRRGDLWVGTHGGGLNLLDPESGHATRYTTQDGLPSSVIQAIAEDREGRIWLSTNRGLASLDPETGDIRAFDSSDGLHGATYNLGASFVSDRGEIFFGATHGLEYFLPSMIDEGVPPPPVVITGFELFGKRMNLDEPIWQMDEIQIKQADNYFAIEFAALEYSNPERNRYRYRLEGFDRDWVEVGNRRVAHYTNLEGGQYVFRVQGSNLAGEWNEEGAELNIEIVPPIWKNIWFRSFIALLLVGLISAAVTFRLAEARAIRARLEKLVDERTAELQEANQKLEKVSVTDPLTSLRNRRYLYQVLDSDVARCLREHKSWAQSGPIEHPSGIDLLFVMADLDHFKVINDTYGHRAGDRVLKQLAGLLQTTCRDADILVRWGGEEFLIVCRFEDRRSGSVFAERIRRAVEQHRFDIGNGTEISSTCSLGIASFPFLVEKPDAIGWEQVLDLADRGLYAAKEAGRNTWFEVAANPDLRISGLSGRLRQMEKTAIGETKDLIFRGRPKTDDWA